MTSFHRNPRAGGGSPTDRQTDEALTICQTPERRALLSFFKTASSETIAVEDLVTVLLNNSLAETPKSAMVVLHHSHLPRLEDHGVITYDSDAREVTYHGHDLAHHVLTALNNY